MFKYCLLIFLFNSLQLFAGHCEIYGNDKSFDHTQEFISAMRNCDSIVITEGIYYLKFNEIFLKPNMVITSIGNVEIHAIENGKISESNPSAIFTIVNPEKLKINNLKFCDVGNRGYAIKIINTKVEVELKSYIEIYKNVTKEIGLVWIGPKGGFTYNRLKLDGEESTWYENGSILKNNWKSSIVINDNIINSIKI